MAAEDYTDRIGEYDGAVLHECVLHPELPYSRLPQLIRSTRSAILTRCACFSASRTLLDRPLPASCVWYLP
jgi:hypothetical protein